MTLILITRRTLTAVVSPRAAISLVAGGNIKGLCGIRLAELPHTYDGRRRCKPTLASPSLTTEDGGCEANSRVWLAEPPRASSLDPTQQHDRALSLTTEQSHARNPARMNVLNGMRELPSTATRGEVDTILRKGMLSERDYSRILRELREQGKWQAALYVGDWLHAETGTLVQRRERGWAASMPNEYHYLAMLRACAASGQAAAVRDLLDKMVVRGEALTPRGIAHAIAAHRRCIQPDPWCLLKAM